MLYTSILVPTKEEWDEYIKEYPEANFLQSWEWGQFHTELHKNVLRVAVKTDTRVVALYSLVKEQAKRGSYLALAGGPLLNWNDTELLVFVLNDLKQIAKNENVLFVRFRPQQVVQNRLLTVLHDNNARLSPMHLTADLTLQLDITQSQDEILKGMRKNTRYEIRRVEKLGITTTISTDLHEIQQFYDIQCDVAKRHNFIPFSKTFLYEQFKAFLATDSVALVSSYLDNQLLAQAFIIFYNGEAVYHYGVSTDVNAKLPGSYAAQWRAIQEAQARSCTRYNFWGIAPENQPQHRFAGVSLFKRGFGGSEVDYIPAHDLPVSPLYWLVYGFERYRKWRRKL